MHATNILARPPRQPVLFNHNQNHTMKTETFESTYALLVRSEEKERSFSETIIYVLLILTMAFAIWQAAHVRITIPNRLGIPSFAQSAEMQKPSA